MRAWEQAPSRLDWIQQAPALLATAAAAAIRLLLATVRLLLGASRPRAVSGQRMPRAE